MTKDLLPIGVSVPSGFTVNADSYDALLERYELWDRLRLLIKDVDGKNNEAWCLLFGL